MRIKSLSQLAKAAQDRKSVTSPDSTGFSRLPAAVMMNMSGDVIHRRITKGLFIYKPRKKQKPVYHGKQ